MAEAIRVLDGQVVDVGDGLAVNVGGRVMPATWLTGYAAVVGDAVVVIVADMRAVVLGGKLAGPMPPTGTTSGAASGGRVPVSTSEGDVSARYVGTAPSSGTLVRLLWDTTGPWAVAGTAASLATPDPEPPAPPTPPRRVTTGTETIHAIQSGSFQPARGWHDSDDRVIQWSHPGNGENRGAWFYGWGPSQYTGRTISGSQLRLGPRLRIGSYDTTLTLHIYEHTSRERPSGDVTRVSGPHDVSIPANAGARWVDIPDAYVQSIVDNGGGLSIVGASYGGVQGIKTSPTSGAIRFNWER